MLDDKLINLKECIMSHIETYQTCLNTTNPLFLLKLVHSSPDKDDADDSANISLPSIGGITREDTEEDEENLIQQFKELLSGLNDYSVETSKQVKIHKRLIYCYFEFIRDILGDYVPKRIHHKMVNLVLNDFEHNLDEQVFTPYVMNRSFDEVMVEEDGVVEDRQRVEQLLGAVNKALKNMVDIQCF